MFTKDRKKTNKTEIENKTHRVSVSLSNSVLSKLKKIAIENNVSMTDAIRIAIATESYFQEERDKGAKILIERPNDGTLREVVFK